MSALARYFLASGKKVSGYDKTPSPLTQKLEEAGMNISFDDAVDAIPSSVLNADKNELLLIYTPAIPKLHPQKVFFEKEGYRLFKRAEVLGIVTANNPCFAVAGTHGKTTTSTLLTHLFRHSGLDCTAFLGGIAVNYESNYLQAKELNLAPMIVEADEYDRSFLQLHPAMAIITSMDADHLDIYGAEKEFQEGFLQFAAQIKQNGSLFLKYGLQVEAKAQVYTYGLVEQADYYASNISVHDGAYYFDLVTPSETIKDLSCGIPGRHNVENAVGASALALHYGMDADKLRSALSSYRGVKRRFEYIVKTEERIYIDDYAHHPAELEAFIHSVKELFPGRKVTGIFQPHLFTRTRDFMSGFASSLSLLDHCILLDIYPAREEPIEGVTSSALLNNISSKDKVLLEKSELVDYIKKISPELLVTVGAGDIDRFVLQLKEVMQ